MLTQAMATASPSPNSHERTPPINTTKRTQPMAPIGSTPEKLHAVRKIKGTLRELIPQYEGSSNKTPIIERLAGICQKVSFMDIPERAKRSIAHMIDQNFPDARTLMHEIEAEGRKYYQSLLFLGPKESPATQ